MKSVKFISIFSFAFLLLCSSCQKDFIDLRDVNQQENIPDTFSQYFGNEISRDFIGTVIDKNHNPIEGVTITIDNENSITDSNGIFILNDAIVNERFGYIKAEKVGYIHGSRSVAPSNGTNKVTIMLLEATVVGSVNSGSAETITVNDGSSVSFDGNFVKEDGSTYSGSVDVIIHHLNPADEDMSMQMPGMLYAENEEGAERMLQTLGMLAVELRGSGGEDLNLPEGSTSEIKIPVDASLMNIAPATIPLWYFDEAKGYWKEEGEATLQGNMYVGNVSHFSFWNCDIPARAITLCVNVVNELGQPINNSYSTITSETYGTRGGFTNENGEVCGYVPINESLEFNVYNNEECGYVPLHTETIGPFNSDSDITVILPDNPGIIQETIIGNLNTCDGDAVTNGYVQIIYNNQTFIDIVDDGTFEINVLRCSDNTTCIIEGGDFINSQITDSVSYTFTSPSTNVGILSTCTSQDEFIQYIIDDSDVVLYTDDIQVILGSDRFTINTTNSSQFLADLPTEIGSYMVDANNFNIFNFIVSGSGYIFTGQEGIDINVTYVGNGVGDYIDINFSGTFINNGVTRSISGSAHVRIDL